MQFIAISFFLSKKTGRTQKLQRRFDMSLHFVSTSILTSSDGIDFNSEVHQESEEQRVERMKKESNASKPLFMQLADREEEKKAEYDAMTKKIFAPPKVAH